MKQFVNGTSFDAKTGDVKIYMNKPKDMACTINKLTILGYVFDVDEFVNKRGVRMLSFKSVVRTTDMTGLLIILRHKIADEIQHLRYNQQWQKKTTK